MFWMTSDALLSTQPSAIHAMDATIKMANPATVTRIHVHRDKSSGENRRNSGKAPQYHQFVHVVPKKRGRPP